MLPGGDDELLALGASIDVEEVSHDKEPDLAGDIAVLLILASSGAQAQNEENVPRHTNLEKHLEVENAKHARVQLGAHEEVIDKVASHAVLLTPVDGREVCGNADKEATENGHRKEGTKLIKGSLDGPDPREVKSTEDGECSVQAEVGVAEVGELLSSLVRQRLAVSPNTREKTVASTLKNEVGPVPYPRPGMRECAGVNEVEQVSPKLRPRLPGGTRGEFSIIVSGSNPHVPHENWEEGHHHTGSKRPAKLEFARLVNLGILAGSPTIDRTGLLGSTV